MKMGNPATKPYLSIQKKKDLQNYNKIFDVYNFTSKEVDELDFEIKNISSYYKGSPVIQTKKDLLGFFYPNRKLDIVEESKEFFCFNIILSYSLSCQLNDEENDGLNVYAYYEGLSGYLNYRIYVKKSVWNECLKSELFQMDDSDITRLYSLNQKGVNEVHQALRFGNLLDTKHFEYCRVCLDAKKPFWRTEKMIVCLSLLGFKFIDTNNVWIQDIIIPNVKYLLFLIKKFLPLKCEFSPKFHFSDQNLVFREPYQNVSDTVLLKNTFNFFKDLTNIPKGIGIYLQSQENDHWGEAHYEYIDNITSQNYISEKDNENEFYDDPFTDEEWDCISNAMDK